MLAQIGLVSSYTPTGLESWVTAHIRYDAEQYPYLGVAGEVCKCIPYHHGLRFRGRHNFI
jgi:hypothetical protein